MTRRRRDREERVTAAPPAPHNVRVLHDERELAQAAERAAEGERRLRARLAARAARDEWMAEHAEAEVGWQHFASGRRGEAPSARPAVVGRSDGMPLARPASPHPPAA